MRLGLAEDERCEAEDERGLVLQSTSNAADTSMNLSVDVAEQSAPRIVQNAAEVYCIFLYTPVD